MTNFTHDRFNGYINALKDGGISFDADLVAYTDFDKENTVNAIQKLFMTESPKPTALVAFKEVIIFDAIKYLKSINHPNFEDIECIGFGNTPFIHYLDHPPLASIEENPESVGKNAIELLLKLINKEIGISDYQKVMVDCKLVLH